MARKANIAREEIHQACWELLEKDQFPNIPRIADYFSEKDGRKCSNTTLMNAIAEWEELYKENQQHKLKELDEGLQPVFHRFSRDVTQALGQLLDEKILETESQYALKKAATEGQYQSLSSSLCELQEAFDTLSEEHSRVSLNNAQLKQALDQAKQRYDDVYSHNQVIASKLHKEQIEKDELRINLSQHEVDLAKLDHFTVQLNDENKQLKAKLAALEGEQKDQEKQQWQQLNEKLQEMTLCVQQIQSNDREIKR